MSETTQSTPPLPFRRPPPRELERDPGLPEGDGLPEDPEDWPEDEVGPIV